MSRLSWLSTATPPQQQHRYHRQYQYHTTAIPTTPQPCHGSVPAHLAHRVEAVRHMLGADDGAELAEDVGEVLVLRRKVEVAHEELALLLRVQRPGRRREIVALRLGRAHEVV